MFQFLNDNILILLTIIGAVISFLASFIGLVAKKTPVLILSVLAVLGFTVGVAYQIYDYDQKKEEGRRIEAKEQIFQAAQKARDNVINEINKTVTETKITVETIARQLKQTPLSDVAIELVSIRTNDDIPFEPAMAFAKGSPNMWEKFADWLKQVDRTRAAPSLSLTLNSDRHHYKSGLLLAYLLTSEPTRNRVKRIVNRYAEWNTFPAEELFLKAFAPDSNNVSWVLFLDANTNLPVAYAPAERFTQELMIYHRLKQHSKIDRIFNKRGPDIVTDLEKAFPSIRTTVFNTDKPARLVKSMIERQLAVAVTTADKKPYVAKLTSMIQLAMEK